MPHEDEDFFDGFEHRPPPHEDDRLWRHPSEWADPSPRAVSASTGPRIGLLMGAVAGVCLVGAVVTVGILWLQRPTGRAPTGSQAALLAESDTDRTARSSVADAVPAQAISLPPAWLGVHVGDHQPAAVDGPMDSQPVMVTVAAARSGGAVVTSVADDGPAARAGMAEGDIVKAVDDIVVRDAAGLVRAIDRHTPGMVVTITIDRRGTLHQVEARLGRQPSD